MLILPTLLSLLVACAPPDLEPFIEITGPLPEAEIENCVVVTVNIENFTVADPATHTTDEPGVGHYHVVYGDNYSVCSEPFCLINFPEGTSQTTTLRVVLTENTHAEILDANDEPYEDTVPINLTLVNLSDRDRDPETPNTGPCPFGSSSSSY